MPLTLFLAVARSVRPEQVKGAAHYLNLTFSIPSSLKRTSFTKCSLD